VPALAAALLVLVAPSSSIARPVIGYQGVAASGGAATVRDLTRAEQLHARVVRVQAHWADLQPVSGAAYDPAALRALDRVVDEAARRGLKVVLFGNGSPCWASSAPADVLARCAGGGAAKAGAYGPRDPADFAAFSAFLAGRYGTKLAAYQIWNEPDQRSEDYFAGPDKVARYVALVKATYPAVKQAAPKIPVLAGSFVGTNGAWLTAMYQAGIKGFYDGIAVHFYDIPLYGLRNTRAVQRKFGDRTPLWLTEFGWSSCYRKHGPAYLREHACLTEQGQATAVSDVFRAVSRTSWIKVAILYGLHDESGEYRFGVVDLRDKPKPVFPRLRALLRRTPSGFPKPTLRLSVSRGRLVASGKASITDVYELKIRHGRVLGTFLLRTNRFGAYRLVAPPSLGTSGVQASIRATWSGRTARAAR
jgi:hypothetical protein